MNKKVVGKLALCFFTCTGIIVMTNHMPNLMRAVYDAIFGEFDHVALFFVLGMFVFEIVILKKWGSHKCSVYLCLGIASVTAFLVLFQGSTSFVDKLAPGADTVLITLTPTNSTIDDNNVQEIFSEYYFADKNLILSERERETEEYQYIYKMAVPEKQMIIGQENVLSAETAKRILSYPYREYGDCFFALDDSWKTTDTIILTTWEDKHIFCSAELLENATDDSGSENDSYFEENRDTFGIIGEMAENSPYRETKQILVMLLLFFIGGAVSIPLLGEKYPWLSFFMSLPIGAAVWCVCGIVFMMLHIPYRMLTMLTVMALGLGIWLYVQRQKLKTIDWQAFINFILPAVFAVVFFAYMKICYTSSDSLMKSAYGYRLARFGSLRGILGDAAPYGILEPMIMSIGYLAGCDTLYVFYPLIGICGVGIMCAGLYYINGKKDNYYSIMVLGAGLLLLFTNFDYVMSMVMMLAHGPTAVYTLIFIMSIVMKRRGNMPGFEWIVSLAATMVLMTRIEGAIYVLFFLALSLGIENESLKMYKVNTAVSGVIIVWNVFQMVEIGADADPLFWTPDRGMLLIAGAVFLLILTALMGRRWAVVNYVKRHYFLIAMGALCLCIGALAVFGFREIASTNLPFFLSHFSNNKEMNARINSGALWTFVLLISTIAICAKKRLAGYSVSLIMGYILFIYFICLFRADVPLHYGYFDSGRRTLVQIMPTAIWMLAYSMGDQEEGEVGK